MDIYLVRWIDAVSQDPWTGITEAKGLLPVAIVSVGFLLDEDKYRILIALSWDFENGSVSQILAIPKSWILNKTKLNVPKSATPTQAPRKKHSKF